MKCIGKSRCNINITFLQQSFHRCQDEFMGIVMVAKTQCFTWWANRKSFIKRPRILDQIIRFSVNPPEKQSLYDALTVSRILYVISKKKKNKSFQLLSKYYINLELFYIVVIKKLSVEIIQWKGEIVTQSKGKKTLYNRFFL